NAAAVTATATSDAPAGSFSFTVAHLASAHSVVSGSTVAGTSAVVTNGPLLLSQASALGFATLRGQDGLAAAAHSVSVARSPGGAADAGSVDVSGGATVGDGVSIEVDGVSYAITSGTYANGGDLASRIATDTGGRVSAAVDSDGHIVLTTVDE